MCIKILQLQLFGLRSNEYNLQPLETVGGGSETQRQVSENLNTNFAGGWLNGVIICKNI